VSSSKERMISVFQYWHWSEIERVLASARLLGLCDELEPVLSSGRNQISLALFLRFLALNVNDIPLPPGWGSGFKVGVGASMFPPPPVTRFDLILRVFFEFCVSKTIVSVGFAAIIVHFRQVFTAAAAPPSSDFGTEGLGGLSWTSIGHVFEQFELLLLLN
jgi:hypothetical protein